MPNKTPEIELVLCKPGDHSQELSLFYSLLDTPIAKKYIEELRECERMGLPIAEPERFYFPRTHRNREWIAQALNGCIDVINTYAPGSIKHRAAPHMDQETMNHLHHYFEIYRGAVLKPAKFFTQAPDAVQDAIEFLNLHIHRYEDYCRIEEKLAKGLRPAASAVLTFDGSRKRHLLADEDYDHFSRRPVFGAWNIDYCELGKPLWDVYQDKDEVVGDANIRPVHYYSADASLQFSPTLSLEAYELEMQDFWKWWDIQSTKLADLGFKKFDKKNAIGNIPVGHLIRNKGAIQSLSEEAIVDLICDYQYFKEIHVWG